MQKKRKFQSAILALCLAFAMCNPVCADDFSQSTNVFYEDDVNDFINEYSISIPATLDLKNDMALNIMLDETSVLTSAYNIYVDIDAGSLGGTTSDIFYLYSEDNPDYYRAYKLYRMSDNAVLQANGLLNVAVFDHTWIGAISTVNFSEFPSESNYSPAPTRYSSSLTFNIHGEYAF